MLGADIEFELEWCSVYTFRCRRMETFRHGRVFFVGDAAHQVSPFGARGANSGIQDTDNLIWKLKLVMTGKAPDRLLDSYSDERVYAADENIMNSTRATDFITPKSAVSHTFRDAVLELSCQQPFARDLINSGRLSDTAFLTESALTTPDSDRFGSDMVPGAAMLDAPVTGSQGSQWLIDLVGGRFTLLYFVDETATLSRSVLQDLEALGANRIPVKSLVIGGHGEPAAGVATVIDTQGLFRKRYDATEGTTYLIRPDQQVTARWRAFDITKIVAAIDSATANH